MKNLKELGATLFAHYPDENLFFVTSDGQAFTEANQTWADAHAKTLEDKKISELTRTEFASEEPSDSNKVEKTDKEVAKAQRAALTPKYVELFGKNPAPAYNAEKMQELIDAELVRKANPAENTGSGE